MFDHWRFPSTVGSVRREDEFIMDDINITGINIKILPQWNCAMCHVIFQTTIGYNFNFERKIKLIQLNESFSTQTFHMFRHHTF